MFFWLGSRAQGASILYPKIAREPYQKKKFDFFFARKPLSKFWCGRPIFDPFESLLPHAATQNDLCSLHTCSGPFWTLKNSSNGLENMQQKIFQCRKPQVSLAAARWPLGTSERIWRNSTSQQGRKTRPAPFQSVWFSDFDDFWFNPNEFLPKNRTAKSNVLMFLCPCFKWTCYFSGRPRIWIHRISFHCSQSFASVAPVAVKTFDNGMTLQKAAHRCSSPSL